MYCKWNELSDISVEGYILYIAEMWRAAEHCDTCIQERGEADENGEADEANPSTQEGRTDSQRRETVFNMQQSEIDAAMGLPKQFGVIAPPLDTAWFILVSWL